MEDIKIVVIQRGFDMAGNLISDLLSKPDWEARAKNIEMYYKDLGPIRETLPEAPTTQENPNPNPNPNANANSNEDRIIGEVCTSDLSPKELVECKECVREVAKDPNVLHKYLKPSATG